MDECVGGLQFIQEKQVLFISQYSSFSQYSSLFLSFSSIN